MRSEAEHALLVVGCHCGGPASIPGQSFRENIIWTCFLSMSSLSRILPTLPTHSFIYRESYVILLIEGVVE
jgi:hypothetical protein